MPRQRKQESPNLLSRLTLVVRLALFAVLGGMVLMVISETPAVSNLLAGVSSTSPLVGLVAGHWQSDSGAICPDGLQEMEVNLAIARRVERMLENEGYRAEVLPEYSPKLNGYQAAVFLSIHCDSCVELSGFKVARMTHSEVPEREGLLEESLYEAYAQATGLAPHYDTITDDMRQYHAFRQIAPETPGAIIECGFMGGDRYLLTEEQDRVAAGIANGLLAFLRDSEIVDGSATAQPE